MKNIAFVSLFILALAVAAFGQSGRRIAKAPSPTPTPEEDKNYSDSTPTRVRASDSLPTLRGAPNRKSKQTAASKPQAQDQQTPSIETAVEDDEEGVLQIETSLVTIPVSVFDRNGLYIPNLTKENFKVFENGREEEIAYFATTEQPFTVVLLLDTSPSTQYKIEEIQNAAIAFVDQLKPQDRVMVVEFDENLHVLSEPTSDRNQLYRAIRKADFGGGTSLYDAVDFALRKRLSTIDGRKAIVLFTDGVDTTSHKAGYDSTLREAEEADAIVFPIYYDTYRDNRSSFPSTQLPPINPFPFPLPVPGGGGYPQPTVRGTTRREYELGKKYLEELALRTGGRVRDAESGGGLETAFAGIAEELRRQYNIGYYPSENGLAGQRRQIKVRVNRPNLVVRARDSYIVGEGEKAQTNATAPKEFRQFTKD